MASAESIDVHPLADRDARGYARILYGAPREARRIAPGWTFAAGGLAMTASDLAQWDLAMIHQRLLAPAAWAEQEAEIKLISGAGTGYGLGVFIDSRRGLKRVHHGGSTEGFLAENWVYPEARSAIVVLVNADYGDAQHRIARDLEKLLLPGNRHTSPAVHDTHPVPPQPKEPMLPGGEDELALAKSLYQEVRSGTLDRARLSDDLNAYFSERVLTDYRQSLAKIDEPRSFVQLRRDEIGGLNASLYELSWADRRLIAVLRVRPDGKVASFVVFPP